MKITIIGASGFVGTRLIGLLSEEPQRYTCKNIDLQQSHFFQRTYNGWRCSHTGTNR